MTKLAVYSTLAAGLGALAVSLPSAHVAACSLACIQASLSPSTGDLPSDRVQFLFTPSRGATASQDADGGLSLPSLYRMEGAARIEVPLRIEPATSNSFTLAPAESLPVGTQLVLEAGNCAHALALHREYQVTAPAPLPSELGTLQATVHRDALQLAVINGSCSLSADVSYADLSVNLAETARPYAALLDFQVEVDGKPHPEFSTSLAAPSPLPHGEARIYATCRADTYFRSDAALTPGAHRVRMTAKLGDLSLQTQEIDVELACTGTAPDWKPEAGPSTTGAPVETNPADAGVEPASADQSDGCRLGSAEAGSSLPGWFATLALALVARRRRRTS